MESTKAKKKQQIKKIRIKFYARSCGKQIAYYANELSSIKREDTCDCRM